MIIDELIFDRTNEDIEEAKQYVRDNVPFPNDNLRFSWDYRALNRTEQAMEYVDEIFKELGYYKNMRFKTDWLNDEITRDEANRYIENLTTLRNFILMPSNSPSVPTTMNGMTIEKANDIEKLIFDINFVIEALKKNLIRSGVATCGQTRMWQQRYRTYGIEKIEEDEEGGEVIPPPETPEENEIKYIEYLESTGTQYIDTEVKGSQNTKVELKYSDDGKSSVVFYFGARGSAYNKEALYFARNSATTISVNQAYSGEILDNHGGLATVSIGTSQHTQVLDKGNWYYDGVQLPSTPISTNFTTPYTLRIFGSCNNGTMSALASIKLYSCKIYENDVLVRDLRPALDENDVACLYDEVSKTYFYNAGSGNFLAGAIL